MQVNILNYLHTNTFKIFVSVLLSETEAAQGKTSVLPPGATAEQDQHWQDLQPSHDHAQGHDQLGQGGEDGEVPRRADELQPGSHVAHTGEGGGKRDGEREVVQGDDQGPGQNDQKIAPYKGEDRVDGLLLHHLAVQSDHLHRAGMDNAVDLPPERAAQDQNTGALHAAAGGPGAGPAEHDQDQD